MIMKTCKPDDRKWSVVGGQWPEIGQQGLGIRDWGLAMWGRGTWDVGRGATHKRRSLCLPTAGHAIHTDRNVCAPVSLTTSHWPLATTSPRPQRSAFTLIEMLIVITIMLMLTVSAMVLFGPAMEDRGVREAARMVTAYMNSARNRAMETGRPCGVVFHRVAGAPGCADVLDQCEVPPSYGGVSSTSTAAIIWNTVTNTGMAIFFAAPDRNGSNLESMYSASSTTNPVMPNDQIQFNCQGPIYTITAFTGASTATIRLADQSASQQVPWAPAWGTQGLGSHSWPSPNDATLPVASFVPYRVFRAATNNMARIAAGSLQLPAGTVVDLLWSGVNAAAGGASAFAWADNSADVQMLFTPDGSVYSVTLTNDASSSHYNGPVVQSVFFLIGKRERMPLAPDQNKRIVGTTSTADDQLPNVRDLKNLWVVINPQTGLITSDVVAVVPPHPTVNWTIPRAVAAAARSLAAESQSMGGK